MPNNSGDQGPWGKRPNDGPPDLLELIKKMFANSKQKATASGSGSGKSGSPGLIIGVVIGLLVVIWGLFGIYVVKPAEQAVVLRFGRYVKTVGAGPHWIPLLIEKRFIVNTQEVYNFPYSSEMLTRDENIVSVAVAVQYRVFDPKQYLFDVVEPVRALRQATSSALRQIVGQMTLNSILTTGRAELRDRVAKQLNKILEKYKTGLVVTDLTLQPAKPPEEVTAAFDDAIKAREDEQRYINQGQAYSRRVTEIAQGKVARLMQSAKAYKQEVVLAAQGETARFLALLNAYKQAPKVTKERLYIDGVQSVLKHTRNIVVDTNHGNLLYLPLQQLMKQTDRQEGDLAQKPSYQSTIAPSHVLPYQGEQ